MTQAKDPNNRHSRWFWRDGDVIIIKKGNEQPQTAPDQAEGETSAAADKVDAGTPAKGAESKEQ